MHGLPSSQPNHNCTYVSHALLFSRYYRSTVQLYIRLHPSQTLSRPTHARVSTELLPSTHPGFRSRRTM